MEKEPAHRIQTAAELASVLESIAHGAPTPAEAIDRNVNERLMLQRLMLEIVD